MHKKKPFRSTIVTTDISAALNQGLQKHYEKINIYCPLILALCGAPSIRQQVRSTILVEPPEIPNANLSKGKNAQLCFKSRGNNCSSEETISFLRFSQYNLPLFMRSALWQAVTSCWLHGEEKNQLSFYTNSGWPANSFLSSTARKSRRTFLCFP